MNKKQRAAWQLFKKEYIKFKIQFDRKFPRHAKILNNFFADRKRRRKKKDDDADWWKD